ncbi:MAG: response regulator [Desulfobacteraceae bacterium]|nr:response regulator [Desulfobacteraceae bacterium]
MKFLVVDDDFVSRSKMEAIVESIGEYKSAESGKEAIDLFKAGLKSDKTFDIIMLDIAMPDMDGTEVLFNIREIEKTHNITEQNQTKIIMVTSHSDKGHRITCIQAGCDDYIVKPFDAETIQEKIDTLWHDRAKTIEEKSDKMKTLIVDDDFISRSKMEAIMESYGECVVAENGTEAISTFLTSLKDDKPFDIIMLDIAMPDMDGTEVLYNIRKIEKNHNNAEENQTKIIMVTSHSDKGHLVTCVQAGCDDYVVKPFNLKSISSKIEKIKDNKQL